MSKPIHNPHDKLFRYALRKPAVAQEFFEHYLPENSKNALDFSSLELVPASYIKPELQEVMSDVVYRCQLKGEEAYLSILAEHQSQAEKLMPFRVYHYLFCLLYEHWKQEKNKPLPAVIGLVFYTGEATPYPYSMNLSDCFNDPSGAMTSFFTGDVPLIDVNTLSEEELSKQAWVGPMARAMRHRDRYLDETYSALIANYCSVDTDPPWVNDFFKALLNYLTNKGELRNLDLFEEQIAKDNVPHSVKETIMTLAEQLKQRGHDEGRILGREEGLLEGREEGRVEAFQEKTREFARWLIDNDTSIRKMAEALNLPEAQVEALKAELAKEKH